MWWVEVRKEKKQRKWERNRRGREEVGEVATWKNVGLLGPKTQRLLETCDNVVSFGDSAVVMRLRVFGLHSNVDWARIVRWRNVSLVLLGLRHEIITDA